MSLDFKLKRTLRGLDYPQGAWNPAWLGPLEPAEVGELLREPAPWEAVYADAIEAWESSRAPDLVGKTTEFYTRFYLQDNILAKVDRATMMVGSRRARPSSTTRWSTSRGACPPRSSAAAAGASTSCARRCGGACPTACSTARRRASRCRSRAGSRTGPMPQPSPALGVRRRRTRAPRRRPPRGPARRAALPVVLAGAPAPPSHRRDHSLGRHGKRHLRRREPGRADPLVVRGPPPPVPRAHRGARPARGRRRARRRHEHRHEPAPAEGHGLHELPRPRPQPRRHPLVRGEGPGHRRTRGRSSPSRIPTRPSTSSSPPTSSSTWTTTWRHSRSCGAC